MIIFFSGTGNSRFVAEKIAKLTGDTLCDASTFTRSGKGGVFTEAGHFVFVVPVYVAAPPMILLDFIRESSFPENVPVWFVMTCAGSKCGDAEYCRLIAREKCFTYLGTAAVRMPQNYIAFFHTQSEEKNQETIRQALPVIKELSNHIRNRTAFPDSGSKAWMHAITKPVVSIYYRFFIKTKAFRTTADCIGCGYCALVCPLDNIRLTDSRPVWGTDCTHCMACINLCAKDAIEYGRTTVGKPRYKGPSSRKHTDEKISNTLQI